MSIVTNYKRDKFDIDLEYGQKFEKHLDEVFKDMIVDDDGFKLGRIK